MSKCPYCGKENFIPGVVYIHTESYGDGYKNFKCDHCKKVVNAYCKQNVIIKNIKKTDAESDW